MACWQTQPECWRYITMLELRIGNLRFCLGFSFFLLVTVICRWQAGPMLLLTFLAILLHELGHLLAMLTKNISVKSINFTVFGVHIVRFESHSAAAASLIWVYLAGPLTNLLLALLCISLERGEGLRYFGSVNLLLGLLHLLPAGNLDGACALRELLDLLLPGRWVRLAAGSISMLVLLGMIPVMWKMAGVISPTAMLLWAYLLMATFREY